jgi:hypothetical protein
MKVQSTMGTRIGTCPRGPSGKITAKDCLKWSNGVMSQVVTTVRAAGFAAMNVGSGLKGNPADKDVL